MMLVTLLLWSFVILVSTNLSESLITGLDHPILQNISSDGHHLLSLIGEASAPVQFQYGRTPEEYASNLEGLLNKNYGRIGVSGSILENPHFTDLESHQKRLAHFLLQNRQEYRTPLYQDHQAMHSVPDFDVAALKKHDYISGQNYGGWDMFPSGMNFGHGSGLGQAGLVKKGKEAKALFILMAPLILLAVFGPILATQAMLPFVANGGLTTVNTVAGGKRKKRSIYDPRQTAELENRLQLFLEVQDFIARTKSTAFAEEMGAAFLRCQKYTERRNKCLERVACEYTDESSAMDPAERRIAKMVIGNVMANPMIPTAIKGRLSKGSTFGKNYRGRCRNYWCEALDGPKEK